MFIHFFVVFIIHYFVVVVSSTNKYVTTQNETTHYPAVSTSFVTIFSTTTRTSEYMFEVHNHNYGFTNSKWKQCKVTVQFNLHPMSVINTHVIQ